MPVRKSDSASLHNLWNFSNSNSVHFEITHRTVTSPWRLYSLQSSFQTHISGAPPTLLILWLHRDAGLAGLAAVSIISVTCPAQQPAAPPVIRIGFILGLKNAGLNLAVGRSLSLSVSWQTTAHILVSQSRPKPIELVFKSLFCPAAVK